MKKVFLFFVLLFHTAIFAEISCEDLKSDPNRAFSNDPKAFFNIDEKLFSCDGSLLNLKPIKELLDVSKSVRGESMSCVGSVAYTENLNKFRHLLLKASFAPYLYAKTLLKPEEHERIKDAHMAYFRYWGHSAFYNFNKFKEFMTVFNTAQTPLVKFYEEKGFETMEAAYFATSVLKEFLTYSVGSYPELLSANLDITQEQKKLAQNISLEQIYALLYSKNFTQYELTQLLNTALLYEKDTRALAEILKRGANVNFGDETAIFFAVKNLQNLKFLLQNGADVNHKNAFGKSVIFYAVELKNLELVKTLLENGADVNDSYIDQNTKAAVLNMGGVLPFYLNMCALEHTKRTLFMHAAAHSTPEILRLLVENGVDAMAIDEIGFNAVDYANMSGNIENQKFLESMGLIPNINQEQE